MQTTVKYVCDYVLQNVVALQRFFDEHHSEDMQQLRNILDILCALALELFFLQRSHHLMVFSYLFTYCCVLGEVVRLDAMRPKFWRVTKISVRLCSVPVTKNLLPLLLSVQPPEIRRMSSSLRFYAALLCRSCLLRTMSTGGRDCLVWLSLSYVPVLFVACVSLLTWLVYSMSKLFSNLILSTVLSFIAWLFNPVNHSGPLRIYSRLKNRNHHSNAFSWGRFHDQNFPLRFWAVGGCCLIRS